VAPLSSTLAIPCHQRRELTQDAPSLEDTRNESVPDNDQIESYVDAAASLEGGEAAVQPEGHEADRSVAGGPQVRMDLPWDEVPEPGPVQSAASDEAQPNGPAQSTSFGMRPRLGVAQPNGPAPSTGLDGTSTGVAPPAEPAQSTASS